MRRRLDLIRAYLGKVAVQLLALASVASSAALLLALNAGSGEDASGEGGGLLTLAASDPSEARRWLQRALFGASPSGAEDAGDAPPPLTDLSPVFAFIGRFYGWWACLVWSVVAVSSLAVQRLGLNSD
jgi:hypothetical protein